MKVRSKEVLKLKSICLQISSVIRPLESHLWGMMIIGKHRHIVKATNAMIALQRIILFNMYKTFCQLEFINLEPMTLIILTDSISKGIYPK